MTLRRMWVIVLGSLLFIASSCRAYADDQEAGKSIQLSGITVAGKPLRLPEAGHPYTMVLVFATWCPICLGELPTLEQFYERHRSQGFLLVGLSEDTDTQALHQLIQNDHLSFPIVLRHGQIQYSNLDDLGVTPVTYLVDERGKILWRRVGAVDDLLSR